MGKLIGVLAFIFGTLSTIVIINGNSLVSDSEISAPNNEVQTFDLAKFGKGKEARICPVSGDVIKPGEAKATILSNGKRIMICCSDCKPAIENNLGKYAVLMY